MKSKSTFTVKLESPGEEPAVFTFKQPKLNDALIGREEEQKAIDAMPDGPEKDRQRLKGRLAGLVKVEGLEDEDGEVTAERILALDIYPDIIQILSKAFQASNAPEAEAKNAASGSPSASASS